MKFNFQSKYTTTDFNGTGWSAKLIQNYCNMVQQLATGFKGALTFTDNMYGGVLNMTLTHGVPTLLKNTLPNAANPLGAIILNVSNAQIFPNLSIATSTTVNNVYQTAQSGYIFVTALYPVQPSAIRVAPNFTPQTSTNGIVTPCTFQTTELLVGSGLVYDGTNKITCVTPGRYLFTQQITWQTVSTAAPYVIQSEVTLNNVEAPRVFARSASVVAASYVGNPTTSGSGLVAMNKGDYAQCTLYQTSGINTVGTFGSPTYSYLEAKLMEYLVGGFSSTVTFFLVGG